MATDTTANSRGVSCSECGAANLSAWWYLNPYEGYGPAICNDCWIRLPVRGPSDLRAPSAQLLVDALEEISAKLDCESPCEPRKGCDACGAWPNDNWCAGCTARRALEGWNG